MQTEQREDLAAMKLLGENEFLVPIGYHMPWDKADLEAAFSKDGVSYPFYDRREWTDHPSCAGIDQTACVRVMLLKHFGRATKSEANIAEMDALGYRPATYLEAYAFAKSYPDLQRQFWIVALGSSTLFFIFPYVAVLRGGSINRFLDCFWFGSMWHPSDRFLFVRT